VSQNEPKTLRASCNGLSQDGRRRLMIQAIVYVLLVVLAFRSLSRQEEANLRGPKPLWKGVIPASITSLRGGTASVVPIGPVLYLAVGRRWRQTG
jgi:hypothetical protein